MKFSTLTFFSMLLLMACSSSLKFTSKIKQKVYPGRHTEKIYTNYVLEFSVDTDEIISIDSIHVFYERQCYKINRYLLKKEKSARYIKNEIQKGNYTLQLPLKEKNSVVTPHCKNKKGEVIIHYKEGNISKEILLNNFIAEIKTKR